MKHPKLKQLKVNRKMKVKEIRKFKQEISEIVDWCLDDIRYYIVDDIMKYLKRRGILYVKKAKNKKKNKKKKKR